MRKLSILTLVIFLATINTYSQELTTAQKAAKMLIVGIKGTTLSKSNPLVKDIKERGVSGVIFFEHNITPVQQGKDSRDIFKKLISDIQALSPQKLFLSIDQEGGKVNRLKSKYGFADMPSQQSVGKINDQAHTAKIGALIANEVKSVGLNLNFSPSVDVDVDPLCPIIGKYQRSFSSDENIVTELSKIYIEQHRKAGILTSLKHFPGHGSSKTDSHTGFTDITNTWQQRELLPYKELINGNFCDMVMVSHLFNEKFDKRYPASISKPTIDSLLRKVLNWNGVVITDDMQMKALTDNFGFEEAIVLGVNAGVDIFIVSTSAAGSTDDITLRAINAIVKAVKSGVITEQRLDESVKRIEDLRKKL